MTITRTDDPIIETVYITKYALTQGILVRHNVRYSVGISIRMIDCGNGEYFHNPDWYTDKAEALRRAEAMRVKKIASLKKQIVTLEKMQIRIDESEVTK